MALATRPKVRRLIPDDDCVALARAREAAGLTVSVCIPARNEAATVADIVGNLVSALVGGARVVDEVVVVDDGSIDDTAAVAEASGARVVRRQGPPGKGLAMADAAAAASGDLLVFLDADVRNFAPHFVTRLLRPLVNGPEGVVLVKAAYRRPLHGVDGEGGRVTELVARPLIERLFPDLAFVAQPLAGEVAIRRSALDQLDLEPGYGVEIGMLVDVARRFGVAAIAQVDLGDRVHRNRALRELADQSRQVVAAVLDRAGTGRRALP
ncbi:MAG: glucosyl-3-phosphoglycerate synthase [Actinomycetota bacterium]|nr:glucosyl-3-phosphoglycerate synthase [Actinomycetota bacterium]